MKEEIKDWDITVEFSGGDPTIHLFDSKNKIVASKSMSRLKRPDIYNLLNKIGIFKKNSGGAESGMKITVTNVEKEENKQGQTSDL